MTGEDVKRQVMEALFEALSADHRAGCPTVCDCGVSRAAAAYAALAPCVVLTREEAALIRRAVTVDSAGRGRPITRTALALLSPDEAGDE